MPKKKVVAKVFQSVMCLLAAMLILSLTLIMIGMASYGHIEYLMESNGVNVLRLSNDAYRHEAAGHDVCSLYGFYAADELRIYLNDSCAWDWWFLAHESGHHCAVAYEGDYSEPRADAIAYELIFTGGYRKPADQ